MDEWLSEKKRNTLVLKKKTFMETPFINRNKTINAWIAVSTDLFLWEINYSNFFSLCVFLGYLRSDGIKQNGHQFLLNYNDGSNMTDTLSFAITNCCGAMIKAKLTGS